MASRTNMAATHELPAEEYRWSQYIVDHPKRSDSKWFASAKPLRARSWLSSARANCPRFPHWPGSATKRPGRYSPRRSRCEHGAAVHRLVVQQLRAAQPF